MVDKLKVVEKKKLAQGPRTRSRANISSTLKDAIRKDTLKKDATRKEPNKARKHKENEVTSSYRPPALKPTCSKVLKQVENGVATGSVFAYLVLRECQKKGIEITPAPESALELNLEKSTAEVEKEAGNITIVLFHYLKLIILRICTDFNICTIFLVENINSS